MPRYVYRFDASAFQSIVENNVSLVSDALVNSWEQEMGFDFALALTADEKSNLDNELLFRGYIFDRQEDEAVPGAFLPETIGMAISTETNLVNGIGFTMFMPWNYKIGTIVACITGAGSAQVEVDIQINTVSIFSTNLTIDIGDFSNLTAAAPYVIIAGSENLSQADRMDIDVISNGTDAMGLKIFLIGERLL